MGADVDSLHAGSLSCVSSGDLVSGDAISRLALTSLALLLGQVIMPLVGGHMILFLRPISVSLDRLPH